MCRKLVVIVISFIIARECCCVHTMQGDSETTIKLLPDIISEILGSNTP